MLPYLICVLSAVEIHIVVIWISNDDGYFFYFLFFGVGRWVLLVLGWLSNPGQSYAKGRKFFCSLVGCETMFWLYFLE